MPVNIRRLKEKIKNAYEQINEHIAFLQKFTRSENDPQNYLESLPREERTVLKNSLIERLDNHRRWLSEIWDGYCKKIKGDDIDLEQLDLALATIARLDKLSASLNDLSSNTDCYLSLYVLPSLSPIDISDAYRSATSCSFFSVSSESYPFSTSRGGIAEKAGTVVDEVELPAWNSGALSSR